MAVATATRRLTFLDIFAGIGGMRRGLESAGHRCVGYIEWDKYARKSYETIFNVEGEWTASDVTTVSAGELPTADIWTFGFPCQDLSVAGKQLGFNGNRSSLFFTVVGLVRELPEDSRPEWLIAENVMGFLSSNRGYDFLAAQVALDEIGYDVEWQTLNPRNFGVPQDRERVFIVGHHRGHGRKTVLPIVTTVDCKNPAVCLTARGYGGQRNGTYVVTYSSGEKRIRVLTPLEWWRLTGRTDSDFYAAKNAGVSDTQLYKQAGNSLVPAIVTAIGQRIAEVTNATEVSVT